VTVLLADVCCKQYLAILGLFFNPEIPRLEDVQSRDFGMRPGSHDSGSRGCNQTEQKLSHHDENCQIYVSYLKGFSGNEFQAIM